MPIVAAGPTTVERLTASETGRRVTACRRASADLTCWVMAKDRTGETARQVTCRKFAQEALAGRVRLLRAPFGMVGVADQLENRLS